MFARRFTRIALGWVVAAACATPLAASAQYFFRVDAGATLGPPSCTSTKSSGTTNSFTIFYNLPANTPNAWGSLSVNGAPPIISLGSAPPGPGTLLQPNYSINYPSATFPFTVVFDEYPADGGVRVGAGIRYTIHCSSEGVGTASVRNVGGEAVAVPALPAGMLAALGLLLASMGAAGLRRRRR